MKNVPEKGSLGRIGPSNKQRGDEVSQRGGSSMERAPFAVREGVRDANQANRRGRIRIGKKKGTPRGKTLSPGGIKKQRPTSRREPGKIVRKGDLRVVHRGRNIGPRSKRKPDRFLCEKKKREGDPAQRLMSIRISNVREEDENRPQNFGGRKQRFKAERRFPSN